MWTLDYNKKFAFKVFSDFDPLDAYGNYIETNPPVSETISENTFTGVDLNETKLVNNLSGGKDISLDLTDKLINIIVDHSGSMSWNDIDKNRFDIITGLISNISESYPGNVEYNIVKYGGQRVKIIFTGALSINDLFNVNFIQTDNAYADQINNIYGVKVVRKIGSFPTGPTDGEEVLDSLANKVIDSSLTAGTLYYYNVYTYDENGNFSDPTQMMVLPKDSTAPPAINNFSYRVLKGSSVVVDNVLSVWHFDEGDGDIAYDFTTLNDLSIEGSSPYWLNKDQVPVGESGLRFNGVDNLLITDDEYNSLIYSSPFAVMGWVHAFDTSGANIPIITRTNGIDIDWGLYLNNNKLRFNINGSTTDSISNIAADEWVHVAVSIGATGSLSMYINGEIDQTDSVITSSVFSALTDMNIYIGGDDVSFFHGYMTEISVHEAYRPPAYISSYASESIVTDTDNGDRIVILDFTIPDISNINAIQIIKNDFTIPSNEQDGTSVYNRPLVIGDTYFSYREDFIVDSTYNFRIFSVNSDGVYSNIFESPNLPVYIPGMSAEAFQNISVDNVMLSLNSVSISSGKNKTHLEWSGNSFDGSRRSAIYYSNDSYPIIKDGKKTGTKIFEGVLEEYVHTELVNEITHFYSIFSIDRYRRTSPVENIVGLPSSRNNNEDIPTKMVTGLSYEILDSNSISLSWDDPIKDRTIDALFSEEMVIYSKIVNDFGAVLDKDIKVSLNISVQQVLADDYAEDIFNGETSFTPVSDAELSRIVTSNIVSGYSSGLFSLRIKSISDNGKLLRNLDKINVTITPTFYVEDVNSTIDANGAYTENIFEYTTIPLLIRFSNPFSLQLSNLKNKFINLVFQKEVEALNNATKEIKTYDGAYINSSEVFTVRSLFSYNSFSSGGNRYLGPNKIEVAIYNADKDLSSNIEPIASTRNDIIRASSGVLPTLVRDLDPLDSSGEPEAAAAMRYCDIDILPPETPQKILIYVKATVNSLEIIKKFFVVFANTLKINLLPNVPLSDGINTLEQFANVYIVDPDNPDDLDLVSYPDDNTLVKWTLAKDDNSTSRPIFSRDSVSKSDGVYSYITNGVADNVFIGPLFAIQPLSYNDNSQPVFERNVLTASVIYNGVSETVSSTLVYKPLLDTGQSSASSHFLMEFDDLKQEVFSDGIDYAKMTISHDASSSTTKYSDCFRGCMLTLGKTIYELEPGQLVYISASDPAVEILWGDVVEIIDPYTGRAELDTSNASSSFGHAYVALEDALFTNVYFRINKVFGESLGISGASGDLTGDGSVDSADFATLISYYGTNGATLAEGDLDGDGAITVKDMIIMAAQWYKNPGPVAEGEIKNYNQYSVGTQTVEPICGCMPDNNIIEYLNEITISGSLTTVFDGKVISLTGGGGVSDTLIPSILIPRESLHITVIDKRVNGATVDNLVVDGISKNEIIIDVSCGGYPVEAGTPIFCQTVNFGDPVLNVEDNLVYCINHIIPDYSEDIRSYASIVLNPIPANETFKSELYVIFPYNLGEAVNTVKVFKIKFFFDDEDTAAGNEGNMFSKETYRMDIDTGLSSGWESKDDMTISRAFFVGQTVNNKIYVIGGLNSNIIEDSVEEYNPTTETWTTKEPSPIKKFAAESIVLGNYIYIFGGLVYDVESNALSVSQSVERYDTVNDSWLILRDMPSISEIDIVESDAKYGIAYGVAEIISGNVYILSGIRDISFDGRTNIYNDRILKYNIAGNSWSYSDTIDSELSFYLRFSPYSFVKDSTIYVLGGASDISGTEVIMKDSFNYNISTETVELSDKYWLNMPFPNYKSAACNYMKNLYIMGGANIDSEFLRSFNVVNYASSEFNATEQDGLIYGLNGAACSVASVAGTTYLYIYGGIKSGKSESFLLINSEISTGTLLLNNKQGINIHINLEDETGTEFTGDIEVSIKGFIQSASATGELIYTIPTEFASYNVELDDGRLILLNGSGNVLVRARSEDVLNLVTNTALFNESEDNIQYKIVLQVTIIDSNYVGKNFIGFVSIDNPIVYLDIDGSNISNNITIKQMTGEDEIISILSNKLYQNNASYINCKSSSGYISEIETLTAIPIGGNEAIDIIDTLSTLEPIGNSPLQSAIEESTIDLSNILYDDDKKLIMVFCDDEPNSSTITTNGAIDRVLGIGSENVPVIISNISFNDISPSLYEQTIIKDYNLISNKTKGQSLTLNDTDSINDYIGLLSGGVRGSLGYGSATYIYDFLDIYRINNLTAYFTLPSSSDGRWRFAISQDRYNYTEYSNWIEPNATVNLSEIDGKYIKFDFELLSGLVYNEYGGSFPDPLVTGLFIDITKPKIDYIFTNSIDLLTPIKEIVVSTETDSTDIYSQFIKSGISLSSTSADWLDFGNYGVPSQDKNGKFIIPKRDGEFLGQSFEPLIRVDKFLYKTTNGPWADGAFIVLFNSDGDIVNNSEYFAYPRRGEILFKTQKYSNFTINIANRQFLKIANEIKNYNTDSTVKIYGWGYLFKKDE